MAISRSISPLEAHLGYWMRFVSNHVSHAFKLKVASRGVTVAEWVVLRELYRMGESHPSDVADAMGMTRGAISKLMQRLSRKRLIQRQAAGGDQRFQVATLLPAGRALVPPLARLADQNDAEFFGHLGQSEKAALMDLLKEIVRRKRLKDVPVD
jgi:DNA-binding MarR family transcriptional regulator